MEHPARANGRFWSRRSGALNPLGPAGHRFPFLTTIHLGDLKRTMLTYSHT
jgi:hypothetical protein